MKVSGRFAIRSCRYTVKSENVIFFLVLKVSSGEKLSSLFLRYTLLVSGVN